MKSSYKRTTNWNKYQSKVTIQTWNPYLDYLIDPSFQRVNWIFVLPFEYNANTTGHRNYYFPKVNKEDYNVSLDGKSIFDQPGKNVR